MKGVFARYDLKHIQGLGIAMFKPRVLRLWVTRSLTHFKHGGFDNSNSVLRTCDNFVPLWGYHFAFSDLQGRPFWVQSVQSGSRSIITQFTPSILPYICLYIALIEKTGNPMTLGSTMLQQNPCSETRVFELFY